MGLVLVRMVLEPMVHFVDEVIPSSEVDGITVDCFVCNCLGPVSGGSCHASEHDDDPAIIVVDFFDYEISLQVGEKFLVFGVCASESFGKGNFDSLGICSRSRKGWGVGSRCACHPVNR